MKVLLFIPRMAKLVRAGTKRQTIRAMRKVPIVPGDELSLRTWTGLPRRSKQEILGDVMCASVQLIIMDDPDSIEVSVNGEWLSDRAKESLAQADGFSNFAEMCELFSKMHGFPFYGEIIKW